MKSLLIGLVVIAAAVFVCLPIGLNGLFWWPDVIMFLKGAAPVVAVLIGIIAIFIGIADMKDRADAKKEKAQEKAAENNQNTQA